MFTQKNIISFKKKEKIKTIFDFDQRLLNTQTALAMFTKLFRQKCCTLESESSKTAVEVETFR